jgi:allantoinase
VQSTLAVLVERGWHERQLPLERIAALTATEPARRFRIRSKGSLAPGQDADLTLIDPNAMFTLGINDLHQRHKMSPYLGASFRGSVRRTIRRGETSFMDGRITAGSYGRLVRPG